MKTAQNISTLLIAIVLLFFSQLSLAETTSISLDDAVEMQKIDDGTCASNIARRFCCHQAIPYDCGFLKRMFRAGECRKSRSARKWSKCDKVDVLGASGQSQSPQASTAANSENLPEIHDGTCRNAGKNQNLCCHQGRRYQCHLLKSWFLDQGLCINKRLGNKKVKCSSLANYDPYRIAGPDKEQNGETTSGQQQQEQQQQQQNAENNNSGQGDNFMRPSEGQQSPAQPPAPPTDSGTLSDAQTQDAGSGGDDETPSDATVADEEPEPEQEEADAVETLNEKRYVCTEGDSLRMRDNNMNVIRRNGRTVGARLGSEVTRITNEVRPSKGFNFVKINDGNRDAWVAKEFLVDDKAKCPALNKRVVCTKEGGSLSLRPLTSGGSVSSKVTTRLDNLTPLALLGSRTKKRKGLDFVEVKAGSRTGWVAKKYLKENKNSCPSKNLGGGGSGSVRSSGSFNACMDRELMRMTQYRGCQQNGRCTGGRKSRRKSTFWCARYTKAAIRLCTGKPYIACAWAKNCGPGLVAQGFRKLSHRDPRRAPRGAIIIYGNRCKNRHPAGHIEYKKSNSEWVSDFISSNPASVSSCRPVTGIYVKP